MSAGLDLRPLLLSWAALMVLLPLVRAWVRRRLDLLGLWRRPTVVVGTGDNALQAARALLCEPSLGLQVVAFADCPAPEGTATVPSGGRITLDGESLPVLSADRLLAGEALAESAPYFLLAPEAREMPACVELSERLAAQGRDFELTAPPGELPAFAWHDRALRPHPRTGSRP